MKTRWNPFATKTQRHKGLGLSTLRVLVSSWLIMPAILSFGKDRKPHPEYAAKGGGWAEHLLMRFSDWVLTHPAQIITVFGIIVATLLVGLTKVEVDMRM